MFQKPFYWFYENKCMIISFIDSKRIMDLFFIVAGGV